MKKFHGRKILFDDEESANNFVIAYDHIFSNGGAHTNRMNSITRFEDKITHQPYYILGLTCDKGTWDYINAFSKFDRISKCVYVGYCSGATYRSYTHYAGEVSDEKEVNYI